MKLKSGLSLWTKLHGVAPRYPRLQGDRTCDVAIVGSGITGALVMHELVSLGLKVVMVDQRPVCTGSTSASTALLLYETDTSLRDLARRHGRIAAARAYRLGRRAIRELEGIVRSLHLECGFRRRKSLYLASDAAGARELRAELARRRAARLPGAWVSRARLRREFQLDFPGAIYSPGCAELDAVAFVQQLLAHHHRQGCVEIFAGVKVRSIRSGAEGAVVHTTSGAKLRARHVVVATGYEAAPLLNERRVRMQASYVISSHPVRGAPLWKDECLIWETARPYFYLRTTADRRIVIGGEDDPYTGSGRRDRALPRKAGLLEAQFTRLFPAIPFRHDCAWCGTFVESPDGLPYIGPCEPGSRIFYALGYGGNGITFSQIAARLLGRLCCGHHPRDAALFRFDR